MVNSLQTEKLVSSGKCIKWFDDSDCLGWEINCWYGDLKMGIVVAQQGGGLNLSFSLWPQHYFYLKWILIISEMLVYTLFQVEKRQWCLFGINADN